MSNFELSDNELDNVTGGSIVFNGDHTTCGHNVNDGYIVNNYSAVMQYIAANRDNMSEKTMLSNMCQLGYLTKK